VKFIGADGEKFVFQLGPREKAHFLELLRLYPVIDKPYQRLSKTGDPKSLAEDQEMLDAALMENQTQNRRALDAMLSDEHRFVKTRAGHRFSLDGSQMEWLLQVLNNIRVGAWRLLGCPDEQVGEGAILTLATARYIWAMELSGVYQHTLIYAFDGTPFYDGYPVRLGRRQWFPNPLEAPSSGLLAVGGDLSANRLIMAYRCGIFPWSIDPITWWSPDPRGVIDLHRFRVSRSLARRLRQQPFEITRNRAFRKVMQGCATAPGRGPTWISPQFVNAYARLHKLGHAHSVECWQGGKLVGGVYGVAIGSVFSAESMFHLVNDASKVALHHLVGHLRERGFQMLDIQTLTPITAQLGGVEIPRVQYLERLYQYAPIAATF
jgi:leucyl/phenylalanyl-tRNA--protein transferase